MDVFFRFIYISVKGHFCDFVNDGVPLERAQNRSFWPTFMWGAYASTLIQ